MTLPPVVQVQVQGATPGNLERQTHWVPEGTQAAKELLLTGQARTPRGPFARHGPTVSVYFSVRHWEGVEAWYSHLTMNIELDFTATDSLRDLLQRTSLSNYRKWEAASWLLVHRITPHPGMVRCYSPRHRNSQWPRCRNNTARFTEGFILGWKRQSVQWLHNTVGQYAKSMYC